MGDFNIDLFKINSCLQFKNLMSSFNFIPLIYLPTRVTFSLSSLIDNIFTNNLNSHKSAVLCTDISDHFPIFTSLQIDNFSKLSTVSVLSRNII